MVTRGASRRGPAPINLAPQSKPALTVEEWEAKAPLTDLETRSVAVLKAASESVPLPAKFEDAGPSRPSTPRNARLTSNSRPGTPRLAAGGTGHALHPKKPIQTPQQFYDWLALVDRSVAHSQEAHFRAHVAIVSEHLDACDQLIGRVDEIDGELAQMLDGWRGVEESGKSLKDACERLLDERDSLVSLTEEIGARLEYFEELEHATRMLNHPGDSLVLQTDFLYMVERVDICIDFLKQHRHYREAEVYLLRFQQCMTRAMTLIKMFFIGSLRALSSDISRRLTEDISPTAQMHLLYTRFRTVSAQLAPLLGELERRSTAHPDELSSLLAECHTAYFGTRKSLLVGRINEEIRGLDPTRTELVELTRTGCSYLKQLCTDEFNLYHEFFTSGETRLYQYLENLCDYLYDDLRPRILHEPRLTALCEVCTVLQALMVLDGPTLPSDSSTDSASTTDSDDDDSDPGRARDTQLHISHVLQMVLQDAQTRLFFKAQSVVQSDIRYFVPKEEDLAYPDKLLEARKLTSSDGAASGTMIKEKESYSQIFQHPSLAKRDTWYPTLQRTVWVLSQLHDFVKPAIFEDIAQEAITLCRQSFASAAEMIRLRRQQGGSGASLDGHLFYVRHLMILRELTSQLQLGTAGTTGVGGSNFTDTFAAVLNKTNLGTILPRTLLASLRSGEVGNINTAEGDVKQGIDDDLRRACEELITECAHPMVSLLRSWIDDSPTGPSPSPSKKSIDTAEFRSACERDLRVSVLQMQLYLEDEKTVQILVQHVRDRIVEEYAVFRSMMLGRRNAKTNTAGFDAETGSDANVEVFSLEDLKVYLRGICDDVQEDAGSGSR